ncbi:MAG: hypothetical protein IPO09_16230 [Anaeromyxobacter sp.]|nr:hypothetical protein [Anaeromyxobacter sp.]MBL0276093.1 hypothetical protein [Anaeromyxobacter sp.]
MTSLRLALAAALLPLLTACTAIIPIDVAREITLRSPAGAFEATQAIDLSADEAVWEKRDKVDAVSVDELTATVVWVGAGHQAQAVDLALRFRAEDAPADGSQDLGVGTLAGLRFEVGASVTVPGSAALDLFLAEVLQGSGRFTAMGAGTLDGAADAVIELRLKGSVAYKIAG